MAETEHIARKKQRPTTGRTWTQLPESDLEQRSLHGAAATLTAQVFTFIARLASTIVLAHILSPSDFGLVAMATPIIAFIMLFHDLGLSMATVQRRTLSEEHVNQLFWVNALGGFGLTLATVAVAPLVAAFFHDARLTRVTMILGCAFLVEGLGAQQRAVLMRFMRLTFLSGLQVLGVFLGTACAILSAFLGLGYWSLVVLTLVNTVITSIGVWALPQFRPRVPTTMGGIRSSVAFGLNYTGVGVLNQVARNIDNILIGRFWGSVELGFYSRAYALLLLPMQQIHAPFTTVVVPGLSKLQDDDRRYSNYYLRALGMLSNLALPAIVCSIIVSHDIVRVFLGSQWMPAARIFAVLGLTAILHTTYLTMGWLYISLARTREQLYWSMIAVLVTAAGIASGLAFGGFGVAIGYTAANALLFFPGLWYGTRHTPVSVGAVLRANVQPLIIASGVGGAVYLLSIVSPTDSVYVRLSIELATGLIAWTILSPVVSRRNSPLSRLVVLLQSARQSRSKPDGMPPASRTT